MASANDYSQHWCARREKGPEPLGGLNPPVLPLPAWDAGGALVPGTDLELVLTALTRAPQTLFSKETPSTVSMGAKPEVNTTRPRPPPTICGEALGTERLAGVIMVADGSGEQSEPCGSAQ